MKRGRYHDIKLVFVNVDQLQVFVMIESVNDKYKCEFKE